MAGEGGPSWARTLLLITTVIAVMGDWAMNHWTNIVLMIFFYGAEFTRAWADYFTGKVSPTDVALKITDKVNAKH